MSDRIILSVDNAHKRFGDTIALDGLNLGFKRGERRALLGPNGAGKTTLLKALSGGIQLDEGRITWLPADITLGIVPQEIALYPLLTAQENLHVFGQLNGVTRQQLPQRCDEILRWIGLESRRNDHAGNFSGGMKRRLNIGCAMLHKPDAVLLDEPTVGVDPQSRQRIWEMLDELSQRGMSILVTTHMLDEAEKVCDQITIIDHGKTIAEGTLEQLTKRTLGYQKHAKVTLVDVPQPATVPDNVRIDGHQLLFDINDINTDLQHLLAKLSRHGHQIADIQIESPSLHQVFIKLTGKDLRDD